MSERIYALLLRLYPARFRERYGNEALQLFRDRARDEKGFFLTVRLWLDLLADLAISIARGYGHVQPDLAAASAHQTLDGVPAFRLLGGESPGGGALFIGGLLSLVTLTTLPVFLNHFAKYPPAGASFLEPLRSAYARWYRSSDPDQQPSPQGASSAMSQVAAGRDKLDRAELQRVLDAAIANLEQHYQDPAAARKMADALLAHEKNGDYDTVTDGPALADLLTKHLRDVSHDMHLDVVYSERTLPDRPSGPTAEGFTRYRQFMEQHNCTFEKVEMLPHHIGYLKLNSFPDPSVCQSTATAAMASLNDADAVIFDLRDNGGGFPDMVMLIAGYLFDHPEYLYNPRENTTKQSWTRSPVSGNRLASKPVYLLTSSKTASGAEQFTYNMKMLKRATLIGETTRGSAHSGVFHRIGEHFGMGIQEAKPINPFSDKDWEGVGVEPDVKVNAADALEKAKELAESRLPK